jgi:hypothetical protein
MMRITIFAVLMLWGCTAEAPRDPYANRSSAVVSIASLGDRWSAIAKVEPEIVKTGTAILYRYDLGTGKSVNIGEQGGKVTGFVLFDGAPDAEGHCKTSFKDRAALSEGLAKIMREVDLKDASRRYQNQIDYGLDKGLQVPAFNTPNVALRAWGGMNCRISVGMPD